MTRRVTENELGCGTLHPNAILKTTTFSNQ